MGVSFGVSFGVRRAGSLLVFHVFHVQRRGGPYYPHDNFETNISCIFVAVVLVRLPPLSTSLPSAPLRAIPFFRPCRT